MKTRASAGSSAGSSPGQQYTWRDGDRVERVSLESGLVVQPGSGNTGASVVTRDDGEVTQPVFRSQAGDRMTLPGGVLLTLDETWDAARVNRFFSDNGIDKSRVQGQDWAVNAFFVGTEPGFPSLNLANELAEQEACRPPYPTGRRKSRSGEMAGLLAVVAALSAFVGVGQVGAQSTLGAPAASVSSPTTNTLTVTWTAPSDNGGAVITAYQLRYILTAADETVDANWTEKDEDIWVTGGGALSYTLDELPDGVAYDVQVRAENDDGDVGPWSLTAAAPRRRA